MGVCIVNVGFVYFDILLCELLVFDFEFFGVVILLGWFVGKLWIYMLLVIFD